jgi:hypothetical protein
MWVDALVILTTVEANSGSRSALDAAMERRGWEKSGPEGYESSFTSPRSDASIVQEIEQDVRQAVYVAGLGQFEAVCLLSDGLSSGECDGDLENEGSGLNLDLS